MEKKNDYKEEVQTKNFLYQKIIYNKIIDFFLKKSVNFSPRFKYFLEIC